MVTCGGQAAVPLAACVVATHAHVEYVEIVSTSASRSVGPATRINIDEYLATTEAAVARFTGVERAKTILIVNPSNPPITMQNTVFAKTDEADLDALTDGGRADGRARAALRARATGSSCRRCTRAGGSR